MVAERLDEETTGRYLALLGLQRTDLHADLDSLSTLQRAHLQTLPFDNLDVYARRPVRVELQWALTKVLQGRGGWCFELNTPFGALLATLGFDVTRIGARVLMAGSPSPMDDHLCHLVHLEEPWLVDVGFGESFTTPLPVPSVAPVTDPVTGVAFRVLPDTDHFVLQSRRRDAWRDDYRFTTTPRTLGYFDAANDHLRLTPGLTWTEKRFVTRLDGARRVTLLHDRLVELDHRGGRVETRLDETEWRRVAQHRFGYPAEILP